jgi:serine/threonine protein kinase
MRVCSRSGNTKKIVNNSNAPKKNGAKEKNEKAPMKSDQTPTRKPPPPKFRAKTFNDRPREQQVEDIPVSRIQYNPIVNDQIIINVRDKPRLPKVGAILGKCRLTKQIGKGSSCLVFTALHNTLQIIVAVKVFIPDKKGNMDSINRFRDNFKTEAQMLAKFNDPHIVRVLDFEDSHYPHIILEYVDGDSLMDLVRKNGVLRQEDACRIIYSVAEGLETAHSSGIIHRDIKPHNILMGKDGSVKLADLGVALITSGFRGGEGKEDQDILCGTPAYVAPEQALDANSASAQSDMYSLGATFYHIITGRLPFKATTIEEMISKHVSEPLTPPSQIRRDINSQISETIEIMMRKDPKQRYELSELKRVLKPYLPSVR